MANFEPSKKQASDFNNGVKYINSDPTHDIQGDKLQAETINNLVENALYTQEQAENAKNLVNSVVINAFAPPLVGMHHIQFNGEPTPAEIWGGTTWEIDTALQGRTIIGSGGDYVLGATGGEETHTLVYGEMPSHSHGFLYWGANTISLDTNGSEGGFKMVTEWTNTVGVSNFSTGYAGGTTPHNIMQPYAVVNYWKRLS